ncbi:MAG: 9-O-acetylesterase, partial [Planctomycetes bacterium]|nr:9-O-acetylesterase [Planctomycetota bacterium]
DAAFSGPRFKSMEIKNDAVHIHMDYAEGVQAKDGAAIKGFAVAGADKKWHWAQAQIVEKQVILKSAAVPNPVAAAYGWAGVPVGNLVNKDQLPAHGFRTDEWQRSTQGSVNP